MQAPKVTLVSRGAQAAFGGGSIIHRCSDPFQVHSARTELQGAAGGNAISLQMPESAVAHDRRVRMADLTTGEPLVNQRYRVAMADGQILEGRTDAEGMTQQLASSIPFGHFSIEALDD